MKAGNHIAGGVVFTGFFASLWNINIFASADTLVFAGIFSIIPDIDHTKSLIGKSFYPLARWIDRRYGHRTITHSLLFLVFLSFISFTLERYFSESYTYSTILFFSVLSHFILDMITVQGIPLCYPFYRNPCVIPGNPSMRINTNDKRAELIAFALFVLVGFTAIDLFQQGFWTSYNRAFGTLMHLNSENHNSKNLLMCEYDYIKNGQNFEGVGFVIETSNNKAVIFAENQIIRLNKKDNATTINHVKPIPTFQEKKVNEIGFFNISYDSLRAIVQNKIISGQIQSNQQIQYIENNITKQKSLLKLEHVYNFQFSPLVDSSDLSIQEQITLNELKLKERESQHLQEKEALKRLKNKLKECRRKVDKTNDLYTVNSLKSQIIDLKSIIKKKEKNIKNHTSDPYILYKIECLKRKQEKNKIVYSGILTHPVITPDAKKLAQNFTDR